MKVRINKMELIKKANLSHDDFGVFASFLDGLGDKEGDMILEGEPVECSDHWKGKGVMHADDRGGKCLVEEKCICNPTTLRQQFDGHKKECPLFTVEKKCEHKNVDNVLTGKFCPDCKTLIYQSSLIEELSDQLFIERQIGYKLNEVIQRLNSIR